MEPGVYYDMTPKEYHAAKGYLNSSLLSDFNVSPDHALLPRESKSIYEIGHAFEALLIDASQGSDTFSDRFFYANADGELPEALVKWIENGDELAQFYMFTKKGALSLTYKTRHAYLDECMANPGRMPMGRSDASMLRQMVENFLKMEVNGVNARDLLASAKTQVALFWEDESGIKKKALLDVLILATAMAHIFDIKSAASSYQFGQSLKQRLWIQAQHYEEGARTLFGDSTPMTFLVGYKEKPYLAQPRGIDVDSREFAREAYKQLCIDCDAWIKAGKPPVGWLPYREDRIYF